MGSHTPEKLVSLSRGTWQACLKGQLAMVKFQQIAAAPLGKLAGCAHPPLPQVEILKSDSESSLAIQLACSGKARANLSVVFPMEQPVGGISASVLNPRPRMQNMSAGNACI
jgi:hypothetical protein